mmetsp:Transcript_20936/g.31562  ORF Transcript_20936/g.31562 Transcript_20936/m.31562 type:complete len:127 (+) Transcript_20936:77-457(+)
MQLNTSCLLLLLFVQRAHGFVVNHHRALAVRQQQQLLLLLLRATELDDIRAMRVKEIQQELKTLRVSTADVFEKEELVKRLYDARNNNNNNNTKVVTFFLSQIRKRTIPNKQRTLLEEEMEGRKEL